MIHLFWGGDAPLPAMVDKVKAFYPDRYVKVWGHDDLPKSANVQWCIDTGNWSVLSDYCRHWAVYNHGGMYIDTDMQPMQRIEGILKPALWFAALERPRFVNCALSGGERHNPISLALMEAWAATDWSGYRGGVPIASAAGPYLQTGHIARILPACKALDKIQATGYSNGYIQLIPEHISFGNGYRAYHQKRRAHSDAVFIHHWEKSGR